MSALRGHDAARIVVAVPVASIEACRRIARIADEVSCLSTPLSFNAVGQWYDDFAEVPDEAVVAALSAARRDGPDGRGGPDADASSRRSPPER